MTWSWSYCCCFLFDEVGCKQPCTSYAEVKRSAIINTNILKPFFFINYDFFHLLYIYTYLFSNALVHVFFFYWLLTDDRPVPPGKGHQDDVQNGVNYVVLHCISCRTCSIFNTSARECQEYISGEARSYINNCVCKV